jgi:hypothetical protein
VPLVAPQRRTPPPIAVLSSARVRRPIGARDACASGVDEAGFSATLALNPDVSRAGMRLRGQRRQLARSHQSHRAPTSVVAEQPPPQRLPKRLRGGRLR